MRLLNYSQWMGLLTAIFANLLVLLRRARVSSKNYSNIDNAHKKKRLLYRTSIFVLLVKI